MRYSYKYKQKRQKIKLHTKFYYFAFCLVIVFLFLVTKNQKINAAFHKNDLIQARIVKSIPKNPKINTSAKPVITQTTNQKTQPSNYNVSNAINELLEDNYPNNQVGVSFINLTNNQTINAGQYNQLFKAASTAKLIAATDFLSLCQSNQASINQNIDGMNAYNILKGMIEVSSNPDWNDLNNFLGANQQIYANKIGLSSFTGYPYNTITPQDMALLLKEIYDGQLLNQHYLSILYYFMSHTDSTNLIQAALPSNAIVYHKYGLVWGYLNDAAIVIEGQTKFVLVIYTNNSLSQRSINNYSGRVNLIHQITDIIQDHLSSI